jgi:hypothetical protein
MGDTTPTCVNREKKEIVKMPVGDKRVEDRADVVKIDALEVLSTLNKGRKMFELSVALEQLVHAVRETGKAGSVTLKLTMDPANTEGSQVFVTAELNGKLPRKDEASTLFFTTGKDELVRNNPEQADLPFERGG